MCVLLSSASIIYKISLTYSDYSPDHDMTFVLRSDILLFFVDPSM